jgi:hypothetical protein
VGIGNFTDKKVSGAGGKKISLSELIKNQLLKLEVSVSGFRNN